MATLPANRILRGVPLALLVLWGCERVNVVAVDVATVEVTPSSLFIAPGASGRLTARVLDEGGDELVGRMVSWSGGDGNVVTVSNDGEVRAMGTGTTTVMATSGGVSGEATVSVGASGGIELSESEVAFETEQGGGVEPRNVQVTGGAGTLTDLAFTVEYDGNEPEWLIPSLNRPTTPATLTVGTDVGAVSSLGPGIHAARVVLTSVNAANSPLPLPVTLTITSHDPAIGLSPASPSPFAIQEGGTAGSGGTRTVSVTNVGGGSLTGLGVGTIGYGSAVSGWLRAELDRGTAPATLTVSLRDTVSSLPTGSYQATVPITSDVAGNSPRNVAVRLTVGAVPALIGLESASVRFEAVEGFDPPGESVGVLNAGGGTLGGLSVSDNGPWLTAELEDETAPTEVDLAVDVGGLEPGIYSATVSMASGVADNSPQDINVSLEVVPAPEAPPATPSRLSREGATTTSITASFVDNADSEAGFGIRRRLSAGGPWTSLPDPGAEPGTGGTVEFTDTGLSAGTKYLYEVWAFNDAGTSDTTSRVLRTRPVGPSDATAYVRAPRPSTCP